MSQRLPLEGIRVLDVASWIAAPAAAVVLGDYGADVIKVEQPGTGDPHRHNGATLASVPKSPVNYMWHLDGRNKRSVALDLKRDDARAALDRLIATADVLITNFPFPVRERLRLRYDDVKALNPRLIYASFTGYGEDGPEKDQAGYDSTAYFGKSGISDVCRYDGQPPGVSLPAQGDRASAMGLAAGILMALFQRERTGEGSMVASSLYANGLWSNAIQAQAALVDAWLGPRPPRETPRSALGNYYRTRDDRWLLLAIPQEDKAWPVLCEALGLAALEHDPRFAETATRRRHATELTAILDAAFAARDWDTWSTVLTRHRLTHAPVARIRDLPGDPQAVAAGYVVDTDVAEMPRTIAAPFQLSGVTPRRPGPGPAVGADTEAVLAEVGLDPEEIAALKSGGSAD